MRSADLDCLWKKCNITNTKCLEKWLFRLKSYNKTQNFKADLTNTSQNQDPEKESTIWIWNTAVNTSFGFPKAPHLRKVWDINGSNQNALEYRRALRRKKFLLLMWYGLKASSEARQRAVPWRHSGESVLAAGAVPCTRGMFSRPGVTPCWATSEFQPKGRVKSLPRAVSLR